MNPLIVVPVLYFLTEKIVSKKFENAIENGINEGVKTVRTKALNLIYGRLYSIILTITINILLLAFAIYLFPLFSSKETSIFIIASVYLSSVLNGVYNAFLIFPKIIKIVSQYGLDFKSFVRDEIYNAAYNKTYEKASHEIDNSFILKKPFIKWFGKTPHEVAKEVAKGTSLKATEIIFHEILIRVLGIVIFVIVYYILFRYIVAPFLMHDVTGMSTIEILLYPFIYSVKYFIGL